MTIETTFVLILFLIAALIGAIIGAYVARKRFEKDLPVIRQEAIEKSRQVLAGQFSEQLAPYLPDFPYKPTEARFVGKPIDFIVFKGLDEKATEEIIFVEVKSGKAKTSPTEKKLKETVEAKKVRWEEYRIPEDITKKKS